MKIERGSADNKGELEVYFDGDFVWVGPPKKYPSQGSVLWARCTAPANTSEKRKQEIGEVLRDMAYLQRKG